MAAGGGGGGGGLPRGGEFQTRMPLGGPMATPGTVPLPPVEF